MLKNLFTNDYHKILQAELEKARLDLLTSEANLEAAQSHVNTFRARVKRLEVAEKLEAAKAAKKA